MTGADKLRRLALDEPEAVRDSILYAITIAEDFSPDLRAQLAEWAADGPSLDTMLVAFSAYAGGYINGYDQALADT